MINTTDSHANVSAQKAVDAIGNRYQMILIAARRAQELHRGYSRLVMTKAGNKVAALQEIEEGLTGAEQLFKPPFYAPKEKNHEKR